MGRNLIFDRIIKKIFTCPTALGNRKYERTSAIVRNCGDLMNKIQKGNIYKKHRPR